MIQTISWEPTNVQKIISLGKCFFHKLLKVYEDLRLTIFNFKVIGFIRPINKLNGLDYYMDPVEMKTVRGVDGIYEYATPCMSCPSDFFKKRCETV